MNLHSHAIASGEFQFPVDNTWLAHTSAVCRIRLIKHLYNHVNCSNSFTSTLAVSHSSRCITYSSRPSPSPRLLLIALQRVLTQHVTQRAEAAGRRHQVKVYCAPSIFSNKIATGSWCSLKSFPNIVSDTLILSFWLWPIEFHFMWLHEKFFRPRRTPKDLFFMTFGLVLDIFCCIASDILLQNFHLLAIGRTKNRRVAEYTDNNHPSIPFFLWIGGILDPIPDILGRSRGTPWTSRQYYTDNMRLQLVIKTGTAPHIQNIFLMANQDKMQVLKCFIKMHRSPIGCLLHVQMCLCRHYCTICYADTDAYMYA